MTRTLRLLALPLLCLAQPAQGLAQAHDHHPPAEAVPDTPSPVAGVHMEGAQLAAHLLIDPGRVGEATVTAFVMDEELEPFEPREVTLSLANPAAGIGPVPIPMVLTEDEAWEAGPIPLAVAGTWLVVLDLQISASDTTRLEDEVEILP